MESIVVWVLAVSTLIPTGDWQLLNVPLARNGKLYAALIIKAIAETFNTSARSLTLYRVDKADNDAVRDALALGDTRPATRGGQA